MPLSPALVTGAGTGVGRAISLALAAAGHPVALLGRRPDRLRATADAIADAGGRALVVPADAADPDAAAAALAAVVDALGPVSVLVNNAGVHGGVAPITQSDPLVWRNTLLTNVYAPYLLCRLCAPAMLAAGYGRLINVGSAAGLAAPASPTGDYVLSKVALNYFTRQLATEFVGTDVSCCVIHPGEVKTEMWQAIGSDVERRGAETMRGWVEMVDRTGGDPPEKAADLVLRIVAAPAAETNGKFLWIDGGIQPPRETWPAP